MDKKFLWISKLEARRDDLWEEIQQLDVMIEALEKEMEREKNE